jgi:hypothetical protein
MVKPDSAHWKHCCNSGFCCYLTVECDGCQAQGSACGGGKPEWTPLTPGAQITQPRGWLPWRRSKVLRCMPPLGLDLSDLCAKHTTINKCLECCQGFGKEQSFEDCVRRCREGPDEWIQILCAVQCAQGSDPAGCLQCLQNQCGHLCAARSGDLKRRCEEKCWSSDLEP